MRNCDTGPGGEGVEITDDRIVGTPFQARERVMPVFRLQFFHRLWNAQMGGCFIRKPIYDAGYLRPSPEGASPREWYPRYPSARPQSAFRLDCPCCGRFEVPWRV